MPAFALFTRSAAAGGETETNAAVGDHISDGDWLVGLWLLNDPSTQ